LGVGVESGRALEMAGSISTTDRRDHGVDGRDRNVDGRSRNVNGRNHAVNRRNHCVDRRNNSVNRRNNAVNRRNNAVQRWVGESIRRNGYDRSRACLLGRSGADSDGENGGDGEDLHFENGGSR
jgi:hypothetical protein